MRQMFGITMEVECKTAEVLETVKKNRDEHASIVEEANVGFLVKAKELLEAKLASLKDGKIVPLNVTLAVPQNCTSEYDTIIKMLSMHTEEHVTLGANEVQMFIEDKWEWTNTFLATNAMYSMKARSKQ